MRLKELRKDRNLLQSDVAKVLSKTITCICDWERGRTEPSIEDLAKLADFFNVSIDYLVGREDDFGNITVPGQSTDQLTKDERELLSCFNKMDIYGRDAMLVNARALAGRKEKNYK